MGRSVTIAAGRTRVVLPNGGIYTAGQTIVLTDEQFNRIRSALIPGTIIDNGTTVGVITNSDIASGAGIAEAKLALASDAAPNVPSRRTLGTGATQAAPGDVVAANTTNIVLALAFDAVAGTPSRRTLGFGANQAMPGNTPMQASGTYVEALREGTSFGVGSLVVGEPTITFTSIWGINAAGDPYYDVNGAASNEDAVLSVNTSDQFVLIKVI